MTVCDPLRFRMASVLIQTTSIRFLFLIICITFLFCIVYINSVDRNNIIPFNQKLVQEAIEDIARDSRYAEIYRKKDKLSKDMKYILIWHSRDLAPLDIFADGQRTFIEKNCTFINCYVTDDRRFLDGDVRKFDAVIFNGRSIEYLSEYQLPQHRSPHQKYIYLNMESSDNYPVCRDIFDDFFNWTATYKLNSDIPFLYMRIKNAKDECIGPKQNMNWIEQHSTVDETFLKHNKSKAAAWFVSNCASHSGREEFVKNLKKALSPYDLSVDIYGACGPLKCPRNAKTSCDKMLEKDYFFYMALENSFAEDYVTEKVLTALQHDTVPVVYGGANYTRFLPPGSYLDARNMTIRELAATMARLTISPLLYSQYFSWKQHYTYHEFLDMYKVCGLCAALNDKTKVETSTVYQNFRYWWNPTKTRC